MCGNGTFRGLVLVWNWILSFVCHKLHFLCSGCEEFIVGRHFKVSSLRDIVINLNFAHHPGGDYVISTGPHFCIECAAVPTIQRILRGANASSSTSNSSPTLRHKCWHSTASFLRRYIPGNSSYINSISTVSTVTVRVGSASAECTSV